MTHVAISTEDASSRKRVSVFDTDMAYFDVGEGDPIVLLHGNPTPLIFGGTSFPILFSSDDALLPIILGWATRGPFPTVLSRL